MQTNNTRERSTGRSILDHGVSINSTAQQSNLLVIQESGILFRVKHLKESTGRVAIDPFADLIDLIDEDQRILDSDTLERLNNLPGQGSANARTLEQASGHKADSQHTQHKSFDGP